ncbi:MAG TPA: hypothetical protein VIL85_04905 [Thermomicrobiales bacterium]|jgi:hypothetical protein
MIDHEDYDRRLLAHARSVGGIAYEIMTVTGDESEVFTVDAETLCEAIESGHPPVVAILRVASPAGCIAALPDPLDRFERRWMLAIAGPVYLDWLGPDTGTGTR